MHRFYLEKSVFRKNILEVDEPRIVFQCFKVLRMRPGERFSVFDQKGKESLVQLQDIGPRKILAAKIEDIHRDSESSLEVHLYQAIPKKPALFELVIQKATELGVNHIHPLVTRRTESRHPGRPDRLRLIAIEASEQSGRLKVPEIHTPILFEKAIVESDCYIAYESKKELPLSEMLQTIRSKSCVRLFIGPEGGFDPQEIELALKKKAKTFGLGPRILRTETAAIVALSLILLG